MKKLILIFIVLLFYYGGLVHSADPECIISQYDKVSNAVKSCDDLILDSLTVPAGETLRLPLRDGTTLTFRGVITFEHKEHDGYLVILNGTNVLIQGEPDSVLYGKGELYWDFNGERGSPKPKFFAATLRNAVMKNINILNTPQHCMQLFDSNNVELSNWYLDNKDGYGSDPVNATWARETDGFDVRNSTNVVIRNHEIHNQDDCVALNSGANILVEDMKCFGGHGLSLSVGFSGDEFILNSLENVTIRNSLVVEGWNGIHIKTHPDGGEGLIKNVTYSNVQFISTSQRGVYIHQNYGANGSYPHATNNVPIRDLILENIVGAVMDIATPLQVICAEEGCFDWTFIGVTLVGVKENNCTLIPDDIPC